MGRQRCGWRRWGPSRGPLTCGLSLVSASVFCVSLDPKTNTLAVTGGEDDKAFVWRLSDGELLFECAGEGAPGLGGQKLQCPAWRGPRPSTRPHPALPPPPAAPFRVWAS